METDEIDRLIQEQEEAVRVEEEKAAEAERAKNE